MKALLPALLLWHCYDATGQACRNREAVTTFGEWIAPAMKLNAAGWAQRLPLDGGPAGVASVRLLLKVSKGTGSKFHVVVRDDNYRVLATLGARDFADEANLLSRSLWTGRMPIDKGTSALRIDLLDVSSDDVEISIVGGLVYPPESSEQRLFSVRDSNNVPNWTELYASTAAALEKRSGDSVGMLVSGRWDPNTGLQTSWCCSGVLIGQDEFLTNWHCGGTDSTKPASYWNSDVCANALIDMAWDDGRVRRQYGCAAILASNMNLDYAIIKLIPIVGSGSGLGSAVAARIAGKAAAGDVFVIHHASCKPKLISSKCVVESSTYSGWLDADKATEFAHSCDTEPGASGAPVFNRAGELVGLHHLGFDRDDSCRPTDHVNKAIHISDILDNIRVEKPTLASELGF